MSDKILIAIITAIIVIALLILGGFISIWVLNTLFSLGILYTWQTVLAAAMLNLTVSGAGSLRGASK